MGVCIASVEWEVTCLPRTKVEEPSDFEKSHGAYPFAQQFRSLEFKNKPPKTSQNLQTPLPKTCPTFSKSEASFFAGGKKQKATRPRPPLGRFRRFRRRGVPHAGGDLAVQRPGAAAGRGLRAARLKARASARACAGEVDVAVGF